MTIQLETQDQVTGSLWLLKKLRISSHPSFCDDGGIIDDAIISPSLLILNTATLYLATSKRDGVIASFYSPTDKKLYLAKSGHRDPEDDDAIASFLDALTKAYKFNDLLPFLAQRSADKVNKRIARLRDSFTVLYTYFQSQLESYKCLSDPDDPEFPGPYSRKLRRLATKEHPDIDVSYDQKFLAYLVETIKHRLTHNVPFGETEEARLAFSHLLFVAKTFLDSRFFAVCYQPARSAIKFKRRLEKIAQYLNARYLIQFYKRQSPISVQWVPDDSELETAAGSAFPPQSITTVGAQHIDAVLTRYASDSESQYKASFREAMVASLDWLYPGWNGEPEDTLKPPPTPLHVHPELRLILYLTAQGPVSLQVTTGVEAEPLFVGCSQSCCLGCLFWIRMFNSITEMRWILSPTHFQPRYDWAFPSPVSGPTTRLELAGDDSDNVVLRRLGELIQKLMGEELGKAQTRVSEDRSRKATLEWFESHPSQKTIYI